MKEFIKRYICKNIIKILTIYKNSLNQDGLIFKNYIDQIIYFEIEYLIKIIKERSDENEI